MRRAVIAVSGEADRLVADGLAELQPVLDQLGGAVLIIGGLMTRVWLHAQPIDVPVRATADVDLGIDRRPPLLTGGRKVITPLLRDAGFEPRMDEQFRFAKQIDGRDFFVDLGIAPGRSKEEPPILEPGVTTIEIPGLAYAMMRRTTVIVEFVDGDASQSFKLPLPELDAAFVLKGALAASGVRMRSDRRQRDTVDAISLAAACADDGGGLQCTGHLPKAQRCASGDQLAW